MNIQTIKNFIIVRRHLESELSQVKLEREQFRIDMKNLKQRFVAIEREIFELDENTSTRDTELFINEYCDLLGKIEVCESAVRDLCQRENDLKRSLRKLTSEHSELAKNHKHNQMIEQVLDEIKGIFERVGEGDIHGYTHAVRVYQHAQKATEEVRDFWNLSHTQVMAIKLAALLHDVDDGKIFGEEHDEKLIHAQVILHKVRFPDVALVLEMIKLVGFRHNGIREFYRSDDPFIFKEGLIGTKRGTLHQIPKWKLIPRDCDRVEALGKIGVARCIGFGCEISRPLFNSSKTPRLNDDWSILKKAVDYWLGSECVPHSTIDYFIKGLVLRTIMSSGVKYLESLAMEGRQPILEIIKIYGQTGFLNREMILSVVKGDEHAVDIVNNIKTLMFTP